MVHELKTWNEPFEMTAIGLKEFEVRVNDRDYEVGDQLKLREYDPETGVYSGRWILCDVRYVMQGGVFGLPGDLCVMSIRKVSMGHVKPQQRRSGFAEDHQIRLAV